MTYSGSVEETDKWKVNKPGELTDGVISPKQGKYNENTISVDWMNEDSSKKVSNTDTWRMPEGMTIPHLKNSKEYYKINI